MLDEAVAVEVVGRLEGEEGPHAHHDGSKHFIANVKVVVSEATTLVSDDTVIWVFGGIFRHSDAERRSHLHALEDKIHAVGILPLHSA